MYKSISNISLWLFLFAISLQYQSVFAVEEVANIRVDTANGQTIYNEGKGDATACAGCHGEKALGMDAMASPRLANIGQTYIIKQLLDYATDKRTDAGTGLAMNGIAKALNEQDRLDLAAYLNTLPYETDSSDLKSLATEGGRVGNPKNGKVIMVTGVKRLVPACQDCHGFSGRAANIPAIHQQKYVYLVNQLQHYRVGSRTNDPTVLRVGIMRDIAKKLTKENIEDISAYLSTVTDFTP